MGEIGKLLIVLGIMIVLLGVILTFAEKLPLGLGKLPGDVVIKKDNFTFYFPIATSLILSLVLTLLLNLIFSLKR